jgi:hypothetical protein
LGDGANDDNETNETNDYVGGFQGTSELTKRRGEITMVKGQKKSSWKLAVEMKVVSQKHQPI